MLDTDHAPGPQQQRGRAGSSDADRVQPVVAGEQRQLRVVVAGLGARPTPRLERDVGRVARPRRRRVPSRSSNAVGDVAEAQVDAGAGEVALGPGVGAPRRAPPRAPRRPGTSSATPGDRAGAGAQVDHHGAAPSSARARCSIAQPASTSVSGRGTNTPGPTASSRWRKPAPPVRCWSGSRAARRATRASYALAPGRRRRRRRATAAAASSAEHVRQQLVGVVRRGWRRRPSRSRRRPRQRPRSRLAGSRLEGRQPGGQVGLDARLDDRLRGRRRAPGRGCRPCSRCGGR